jgi:hypothetical protein
MCTDLLFSFLSYAESVPLIVRIVFNSMKYVRSYDFKICSAYELDKGLDLLSVKLKRNYIICNNIVRHAIK